MSKVTFPSQLMDFNPLWWVTWWCRRAVLGHYTFFQNFRHEGEVAKVSWRSLGGATPCCWYWFSTYLCIVQSIMQSRKIPGTFCPWLWKQILRHFRDFQVTNWDSHLMFVSIFSPNSSQTVGRNEQISTCIEKKTHPSHYTKDASSLGRLGIFDLQCYPFQLHPPEKFHRFFKFWISPLKKASPFFRSRPSPFFSKKRSEFRWFLEKIANLRQVTETLKRVFEEPHFKNRAEEVSRGIKDESLCSKSFFRVFGCLYVREISLQVEFKKLACVSKVAPIKWWIGQVLTIILTFWRGWIPYHQMTHWRLIFLVWFLNGHSDFTQRAAGTCVYYLFGKVLFPTIF